MDNFKVTELHVTREDTDIFGQAYLPDDASDGKRVPVVIYAHGLGANAAHGDGYARELAKRGYAVYCFDFVNGGSASSPSKSTPQDRPLTLFSEQSDLEAVFDEISSQPWCDRNNVFLMGSSFGGMVSALTAANRANLIKGIILLYPAFSIPADLRKTLPDPAAFPENFTLDIADDFGMRVSRDFAESLYNLRPFEMIDAYRGPVLILQGTADPVVPYSTAMQANKVYRRCQLELISDAGHGFSGGYFKYAVKKIVGFLDEEADLGDESGLDGDLNFGAPGMGGMFG